MGRQVCLTTPFDVSMSAWDVRVNVKRDVDQLWPARSSGRCSPSLHHIRAQPVD